jgi:hypothetical protein
MIFLDHKENVVEERFDFSRIELVTIILGNMKEILTE